MPARQIRSAEEFFRAFPGVKDVFIDGTERPVQKPKNLRRRKKMYSGKKRQTTRKGLIMTDETRQIGFIPMSKNGRRHDKRLLDKVDIIRHIPPEVTIWADTGFQGIDKQHPNTQIPKKGTRKRPLSPEQKQENKIISGIRITVEHAIAGIKRLGCMNQILRNRRPLLMIPSYSLAPVFGISISEQRKIYFNHRNTLISLLSNTLDVEPFFLSQMFSLHATGSPVWPER
ncbi:transposase family protein [Symbiopectobacterium purcellii]|uniref:transposase family protein n=1 Tax=Symbiopectobacterium purcellii TaxID=2871826 RepID=UPI003F84D559